MRNESFKRPCTSTQEIRRVILSDVDPKLCTKVKLMSELKQFHPHIKVSKVLEKKNNSFLIIGDTPRDVAILQSETKMKACLGQNVKISLPKAYQSSQPKKESRNKRGACRSFRARI